METKKLAEIGTVVTGKTPSTSRRDYYDGDIPFVTPNELHAGRTVGQSAKTLSEAGLQSIKGSILEGTSVLVGCIGWDMGNVAMTNDRCASNQQINAVTSIISEVNPEYLYYWLSTKKDYLLSIASVTRTPILSKSTFEQVKVPVPSRDVQDGIARILASIDDQIATNDQVNDNLHAMLQTLYGYWFLQFDFPDKNGQPYRASGGRMVWNNQLKREIPAGWLVASITDHADVYQPKTISSRLFDDSHPFPVYGGGGYIGRFNQFNHQESEVIISCRGDCGRVYLTMPESWVTGNAMVVHPRGDCLPKEYLYLLLKNSNLEHYVTGSVQKQLTRQNFELLPILVPSRDVLERFTSFTKITISRQLEIVRENRKLQELRDWLLPMLMNGQATVTSSDKLSFT